DAWADGDEPVVCVVPEGVAAGALDRWTEGQVPHPGQSISRGRLVVAGIPFLAQDDYDRLLWASDINFVRGEDSFVRALGPGPARGRPPLDEHAHTWAPAPAGQADLASALVKFAPNRV